MFTRTALALAAGFTLISLNAFAAGEGPTTKVAYQPGSKAASAPDDLDGALNTIGGDPSQIVFSAPPRESKEASKEIYQPIAEYLTSAIGKTVTYRHPDNWLTYQTEMQRGSYDLVFDGPHFNSWRAANLRHNILVKAPGDHTFVVAVRKEDAKISEIKQLVGRPVCAMSPPNLGTLTLLGEFENPVRQPLVMATTGWDTIYNSMISGRCSAAVLPLRNLEKYDRAGAATRIIFKAKALPNQAFSAGPRVPNAVQGQIARALLAPEARVHTAKLRDAYAIEGGFLPAATEEYAGVASILKDTWGYQ